MNSKRLVCIFICSMLLMNCRGQPRDEAVCRAAYGRALTDYGSYYLDNNQEHLSRAIAEADSALACDKVRSKAVLLKVTVLLVLKKYEDGYDFVRSLDATSFAKPYMKYTYENWFLAHVLESKGDLAGRDSVYRQMEIRLEKYINAGRGLDGDFDELAFTDLYGIKWQLEGKSVLNEIDSLKKRWPLREDFFNSLKVTIQGKPFTASTEAH